MTNAKIYREWKQAKDPKNQITIIADMEFGSKKKPVAEAIMEQCELNGEPVPLYIKKMAGLDINEDLKALVEQGLSQQQIADEFGVTSFTVYQWIRKAGLKSRSKDIGAEIPNKLEQSRTDPDDEKALASAPSPMVEVAAVIADCAAKLGKGTVIVTAYPDGSCSIVWELEVGNEKA